MSNRDQKLIQYLTEAHGKEQELVTALEAHIAMTTRAPYKKRLQQHLKETKQHARDVERRIKQLGGSTESSLPESVADAAATAQGVASKAVSAAKGGLHAIRGTGESEKMLKNAKTEFSEEHEEIAMYSGIEALAETVGDRDTVKLARSIRREEERMANFLAKQIPTLAKAVAKEEIPAAEWSNGASPSRRRTSSSGSRSRSTRSRSKSGSKSGSSSSRRTRASSSR
jgi:ferritin-like metal-binding protein YciE